MLLKLHGLSTRAAYDLLAVLGHENVFAYHLNRLVLIRDWVKSDDVEWQLTHQTGLIQFWGGPPGKEAYFLGTLYTLVLDRVYNYLCHHSMMELRHKMGMREAIFQYL
jgi:hypothetical protein